MNEHIILGNHDGWGGEAALSLSQSDRRHHVYVLGKSGTGKSTLLRNMLLQDVEAGRGVGLIDPHGDLSLDVLDHIPSHRVEDVVYFDPSDLHHPVGFNLVGQVDAEKRHLVASGVVSVFRGIWPDSWGARLEYILYACVAALLDCENVTLMGIPRMLSDEGYRSWVVKQIKDPMVRSFWVNEFARYDKRFLQEAISPIQNKVGQLLMAPAVRNILGQVRGKLDARFMMDEERIFIANLSKGKLGADKANLLGALWVTQFQLGAMARADAEEHLRPDFNLYIDEFQSFISDSFVQILSEARKYRLGLTLAHQYMSQVKPGILDAVMGNVGSIVAFRVGHADAEALELAFGKSVTASQFTSLSNGEVYAKLLAGGQERDPLFGRTHPPGHVRRNRRDTIIRRSREKYATSRAIVQDKLPRWLRS